MKTNWEKARNSILGLPLKLDIKFRYYPQFSARRVTDTFFHNFDAQRASSANRVLTKNSSATLYIKSRSKAIRGWEASSGLGVNQHTPYEWKRKFAAFNSKRNEEAEEIMRLTNKLAPYLVSKVRASREIPLMGPIAVLALNASSKLKVRTQWILM
ncbi:hypothetical protein [Agrobacterium pusense]|uniref:hypothetical protein n=1 Tax=Agrobacterium pusense TaxID=648995 RepID=UPI000D1B7E91|nr:hypothetical protein [Agrobacterium pusense]